MATILRITSDQEVGADGIQHDGWEDFNLT